MYAWYSVQYKISKQSGAMDFYIYSCMYSLRYVKLNLEFSSTAAML